MKESVYRIQILITNINGINNSNRINKRSKWIRMAM